VIKLLKVTGYSLSPFFLPDDYVLVVRSRFLIRQLKPGDIIAFLHSQYGLLIKKVENFDKDTEQIIVSGTHPSSIDSRQFGPILFHEIVGKVVWHVKNPDKHFK